MMWVALHDLSVPPIRDDRATRQAPSHQRAREALALLEEKGVGA
jgi:hypothetical protein